MSLIVNPHLDRDRVYSDAERAVISLAGYERAAAEIRAWPDYQPTPLHSLLGLAGDLGIGQLWVKDESERFGLGSFKALGGAYGVLRVLEQELGADREALSHTVTVTCATDGNHGRSVAWGARTYGSGCVIYLPGHVTDRRVGEIAAFGARTVRVDGTYDQAVAMADADARSNGWFVVSDHSYEGYMDVPRWVMQGYTVMVDEMLGQTPDGARPTHVFLQGGVGGVAAAVCGHLWELDGAARPLLTIVEPEEADCLYQSAAAGTPTHASGSLHTIMGGLSCGEISPLAWTVLDQGADAFMTAEDTRVEPLMRRLAEGRDGDVPVVAGESGVAGLAGLESVSEDPSLRSALRLGADARVLVVITEGATDADSYKRIVGRTARDVASSRYREK
jgi:diaminopropionate ammonia-lyase